MKNLTKIFFITLATAALLENSCIASGKPPEEQGPPAPAAPQRQPSAAEILAQQAGTEAGKAVVKARGLLGQLRGLVKQGEQAYKAEIHKK